MSEPFGIDDLLKRMRKHDQSCAAVVELIRQEEITRRDLITVADKHNAPFKTVVQELERLRIVPLGTYQSIIDRFKTPGKFREVVEKSNARQALGGDA